MVATGLTSVTFRKLDPLQVIQLTKSAGLQSIEWGGDIHVPAGDLDNAKKFMTRPCNQVSGWPDTDLILWPVNRDQRNLRRFYKLQ